MTQHKSAQFTIHIIPKRIVLIQQEVILTTVLVIDMTQVIILEHLYLAVK